MAQKMNFSTVLIVVLFQCSMGLSAEMQAYSAVSKRPVKTTPAKPTKPVPTKPTRPTNPPPPTTSSSVQNLDMCFSPGNCDLKLIGFIDSAKRTLDVAIYSITHAAIAKAIEDAKSRGVVVRMVVDRSQSTGTHSLTGSLVTAGIPLKIGNVKGIMHNKFTIVDGGMIETGSFNYTDNATRDNAENQIYIDDVNVVSNYSREFETLWQNALAK